MVCTFAAVFGWGRLKKLHQKPHATIFLSVAKANATDAQDRVPQGRVVVVPREILCLRRGLVSRRCLI